MTGARALPCRIWVVTRLAAPSTREIAAASTATCVSRFATCCRALGLSVHDRQRPADLVRRPLGFAELTRIARDHCDAWTGLAAAGDTGPRVIESVWRTVDHGGCPAAPDSRSPPVTSAFTYDTGLYLQFRAADPRRLPAGLRRSAFR